MNRVATAILVVAPLLLGASCAPPRDVKPSPTATSGNPVPRVNVNVGVSTDMPGLGVYSGYNRSGFDVDLYQWIGHHAEPKFNPVAVPIPVSDRVNAIMEKRVGMVVEAFSITDDRRKSILFAGPYLITKQGFMVRAGDSRIQNMAQLTGMTVCTLAGSTSKKQLTEGSLKERVTVTEETGIHQCVTRLLSGLVDVVSTDQFILYGLARANPAQLSVIRSMTFGADERYGIGLPRDDVNLCKTLTAKIREFIIDGHWDQFFKTNFGDLEHPSNYKPDVDRLDRCD